MEIFVISFNSDFQISIEAWDYSYARAAADKMARAYGYSSDLVDVREKE
jgi:hypothetical protein